MAADHNLICKFESTDGDDYELAISNLEDMVEGALNAVQERKRMEDLSVPLASLALEKKPICT
jgi:hypothetical protein